MSDPKNPEPSRQRTKPFAFTSLTTKACPIGAAMNRVAYSCPEFSRSIPLRK